MMMTEQEKLRYLERIKAMTRVFGPDRQQDCLPVDGELLIVVCPGDALQIGFDLARKKLAAGARVRLCGHGVTLSQEWPKWIQNRFEGQLILTELGAYSPEMRITPWNSAVRFALRGWLSSVMGGFFRDVQPKNVFLSSFISRLILLDNDPSRYMGLAQIHCDSSIEYTSPNWEGALVVRTMTEKATHSFLSVIQFNIAIVVGVFSASFLAIYRVIQEYLYSRGNCEGIEELRAQYAGPDPSIWFALMPSNLRMNLYLNQWISKRGDRSVGLLMIGSLRPVLQRNSDLKREPAKKFLEGLGAVSGELENFKIDQISQLGSMGELLQVTWQFIVMVPKLTLAVLRQGYLLDVKKDIRLNLNFYLSSVIRLLTMDVLRVLIGCHVAKSFLQREDIRGKKIIFVSAVSPDVAAVSSIFRKNQACCVEYLHGVGAAASEATDVKVRWDFSEMKDSEILEERVVFSAASPVTPIERNSTPVPNKLRILLLSNYVHRDSGYKKPYCCFQNQMLSVVPYLLSSDLCRAVRWRPHPADDRALVVKTAQKYKRLELSLDRSLEDDFDWADIVVSSYSTVISQALVRGVPVFVHLMPEFQDISLTKFLASERVYFTPQELIEKILEFIRGGRRLDSEEFAKVNLWGPKKTPDDFFETLERLAV